MLFAHDGWGANDSFVFMHLRRAQMGIDHENNDFSNAESTAKASGR